MPLGLSKQELEEILLNAKTNIEEKLRDSPDGETIERVDLFAPNSSSSTLLSAEQYLKILKLVQEILSDLQKPKNERKYKKVIEDLLSSEERAVRLSKVTHDIDRTVVLKLNIDDAENQHLDLHVLTNTHDFEKKDDPSGMLGKGTDKSVKQMVTIECTSGLPYREYEARARVDLSEIGDDATFDESLQRFKDEVDFPKRYPVETQKYFLQQRLGSIFDREDTDGKKYRSMYLFSEAALGTLKDLEKIIKIFFSGDEVAQMKDDVDAGKIPLIYYRLLRDIMLGVKEMHERGDVHSDLKEINIMIVMDTDGNLRAKINDFGISVKAEEKSTSVQSYTFSHASPEAFFQAIINKNPSFHKYIMENVSNGAEAYGLDLLLANKNDVFYPDEATPDNDAHARIKFPDDITSDTKEDIWALGIIAANIFSKTTYGRDNDEFEAVAKKFKLLDTLLQITPDKRPDINQALVNLVMQYWSKVDFAQELTADQKAMLQEDLKLLEEARLKFLSSTGHPFAGTRFFAIPKDSSEDIQKKEKAREMVRIIDQQIEKMRFVFNPRQALSKKF